MSPPRTAVIGAGISGLTTGMVLNMPCRRLV